jgi:hypothetical protein
MENHEPVTKKIKKIISREIIFFQHEIGHVDLNCFGRWSYCKQLFICSGIVSQYARKWHKKSISISGNYMVCCTYNQKLYMPLVIIKES